MRPRRDGGPTGADKAALRWTGPGTRWRRWPRSRVGLYAVVALIAIVARIYPAVAVYQPSPDAVEYLSIARSLDRGEGYETSVRAYFPPPGGVRHPAIHERAPLWPLLLAGARAIAGEGPPLQLLGVGLAALAAVLACALALPLGGRHVALATGVVVAVHPALTDCAIHLWAEPLALVLLLASLALLRRASVRARLASGLAAGLAVAAHPMFLPGAAVLAAVALRRGRGAAFLAGAAFPLLALGLFGLVSAGHPFPTQRFLSSMLSHHEATWGGYGRDIVPLADRPGALSAVMSRLGENARDYTSALCGRRGLFLATLGLLLACLRPRRHGAFLAVGAVQAAAAVLAWPTFDATRFLLPAIVCWLPAALAAVASRWKPALLVVAIAGVVPGIGVAWKRAALAVDAAARGCPVAQRGDSSWWSPDHAAAFGWLGAAEGVVATRNPWAAHLLTGRPAVLLPADLDEAALHGFLDRYGVRFVLLCPGHPYAAELPEPLEYLPILESIPGVHSLSFGSVRVFDLAPAPAPPP